MKSRRYILSISVVLFGLMFPNMAQACWGPWDYPSGYYLYRVVDPDSKDCRAQEGVKKNIALWKALTSADIPDDDIRYAVYSASYDELWDLRYPDWNPDGVIWKNKFFEWIVGRNDQEIVDLLLLARQSEDVRGKMTSPWYYPCKSDGMNCTLEFVFEKAKGYEGERLLDRYVLQAIRAGFAAREYEECLEYWASVEKRIHKGYIRDLIESYVSGCYLRTGEGSKAMERFAAVGDLKSVMFCANRMGKGMDYVEVLRYVYDRCGRIDGQEASLQTLLRSYEADSSYPGLDKNIYGTSFPDEDFMERLKTFCISVGKERKVGNEAMWFYTAADIAAIQGNLQEASRLCSCAESSRGTVFVKESVRFMRFWLDVQILPLGDGYDANIYAQLRWLCPLIKENLDSHEAYRTALGYDLRGNCSYYYYNDMLRKVLLGEACPRLIAAGRTVRALQLANMADNYIYQVSDDYIRRHGYVWDTKAGERKGNAWKETDFSNNFFEMIDSLGVDAAIAYGKVLMNPVTSFDAFLAERSYRDKDYINDIIGTQCLRNLRYADAERYLGRVLSSYQSRLNVSSYFRYDPFLQGYERVYCDAQYIQDPTDYKFNFASEMHRLEKVMSTTGDAQRQSKAMLRYARGMENSFTWCWALTQYYMGENYYFCQVEKDGWPGKRDWQNEKLALDALEKSRQINIEAVKTAPDKDDITYTLRDIYGRWDLVTKYVYPDRDDRTRFHGKCDGWLCYMESNLDRYRN